MMVTKKTKRTGKKKTAIDSAMLEKVVKKEKKSCDLVWFIDWIGLDWIRSLLWCSEVEWSTPLATMATYLRLCQLLRCGHAHAKKSPNRYRGFQVLLDE